VGEFSVRFKRYMIKIIIKQITLIGIRAGIILFPVLLISSIFVNYSVAYRFASITALLIGVISAIVHAIIGSEKTTRYLYLILVIEIIIALILPLLFKECRYGLRI
jgi:hypothetical protein